MPKIELSTREKICLAGYAVLGKEFLAEAFDMCHNINTTNPGSLAVMRSNWINKTQAKEFVLNIRKQYADSLLENIGEDTELSEKQLTAIIQRGIVSEKDPKRQADMSLKLMQWRKDAKAEEPEKERRRYVLPFVSHCRACRLMAAFKAIFDDPDIKADELDKRAKMEQVKMINDSRKAQNAARERILSGKRESGDDKLSDAIGWIFSNLEITIEDCYDIIDLLKRQKEGKSDSVPHWKNR